MSTNASSQPAGDTETGFARSEDTTAGQTTTAPAAAAAGEPQTIGLGIVAALVLCSGACGLIYQTAWLRELRLVFGISTPATAATLAIFMAGLGVGSHWLGARADRVTNPLFFYGALELGIAASAALSPALLGLVRIAYFALGGQASLGLFGSTLVRLALAACVIGVPAVLMGGTLPALARAVTGVGDAGRSLLARVYALNTLGAVVGVVLATFVLLERFGAHLTVWLAAAVNLAAGLVAVAIASAQGAPAARLRLVPSPPAAGAIPGVSPRGVYAASALVGFVFFLMEIVWYRMLTPLMGGTTYTFGVILAIALLGIGVGSALFGAVMGQRAPTRTAFAFTCGLEALALAFPYALGDRLAVLAMTLRPLGLMGFGGSVVAWCVMAGIVVMPAAMVAGFQFPLLVRLLGSGGTDIGRHTGRAYAWNTAGAIVGSLAGGFGLLPWLTAPGVWYQATWLLAALSVWTVVASARSERSGAWRAAACAAAIGAILLVVVAQGPTAFWRHTGIGAGRLATTREMKTPNDLSGLIAEMRGRVGWQAEGRESSIAAFDDDGLALIVGGKSDGNIIADAGTQVMVGMVGAMLHPRPQRALVIGLGTGSTSGWLGRVPSMERVDTIELEPAVVDFARRCAIANQDVTRNPKEHIVIGHGREFMQTTRDHYDLIVSEPSNPYRAGVASMFTREFYASAEHRLAPGGMFLQWVQTYEADFETLRIVYATMGSVFPNVESWATEEGDLLLVGSQSPVVADVGALRARIAQEPLRSALEHAWRVRDVEGVLAHYIGDRDFGLTVAGMGEPIVNTDDRTTLEYRFARGMGSNQHVDFDDLRLLAMMRQHALPRWSGLDQMDPVGIALRKATMHAQEMLVPPPAPPGAPVHDRVAAMGAFVVGNYPLALRQWEHSAQPPIDLTELAMMTAVMCENGDARAMGSLADLRRYRPVEADFLLARLLFMRGDSLGATTAYESACREYRTDPWAWPELVQRQLPLALQIAQRGSRALAARLFTALERPFAVSCSDDVRLGVRFSLADGLDAGVPGKFTSEALDGYGAVVPWDERVLANRARCYERLHDPRAADAQRDLEIFEANAGPRLRLDPTVGG